MSPSITRGRRGLRALSLPVALAGLRWAVAAAVAAHGLAHLLGGPGLAAAPSLQNTLAWLQVAGAVALALRWGGAPVAIGVLLLAGADLAWIDQPLAGLAGRGMTASLSLLGQGVAWLAALGVVVAAELHDAAARAGALAPHAAALLDDEAGALRRRVREALDRGQFYASYHAKIMTSTHRVVGFTGVGRLLDVAGPTAPAPAAVQAVLRAQGWMPEYFDMLLDKVLADVPSLCKGYGSAIRVALEVPTARFTDPGFPARLSAQLRAAGVLPRNLALEVGEEAFAGGLAPLRAACEALRALGVQVALGGFGGGFAALRGLRDVQFDEVRIHRDFAGGIDADERSQWVLTALCDLGRDFNCRVVIEGADDLRKLERFSRVGGDFVSMTTEYTPGRMTEPWPG